MNKKKQSLLKTTSRQSTNFLTQFTSARIALGAVGHALPTNALLKFQLDCAAARDAVACTWDWQMLQTQLLQLQEEIIVVHSCTNSRAEYLQRPDLGRALSKESSNLLKKTATAYDMVFIVSDGLSAQAIETHFLPLWQVIKTELAKFDFKIAPLVLAPYSRVALSDPVGFYLQAQLAIIFIGERPGLSASDSLGIYLTYDPKPGNTDANRNCISNIRPPEGLSYPLAAHKLIYLIKESLSRKLSGFALKDEG